MTTRTRACLLAATLLTGTALAGAQTLPRQGMSMDEVQRTFGAPAYDLGAVGRPAITRWVYDGFTVYFEGRRVINSVQTQSLDSVGGEAPVTTASPATGKSPAETAPPAAPVSSAPPATRAEPVPAPAPVAPVPLATPPPATPVETARPAPAATAPVATSVPSTLTPAAEEPVDLPTWTPAPKPAPAPAPAAAVETPAYTPPPARSSSGSGFRFDPVTGRLILLDEEAPAEAPATPPAEEAEEDEAPASAGEVGTADDQTLEFDPETGTFRAR